MKYYVLVGYKLDDPQLHYICGPWSDRDRIMAAGRNRNKRDWPRCRVLAIELMDGREPSLNTCAGLIRKQNNELFHGMPPWEVTEMWLGKIPLKHPELNMAIDDPVWETLWNQAGETMDLIVMEMIDSAYEQRSRDYSEDDDDDDV